MSASSQEAVTGTKFTFPLETSLSPKNLYKMYKTRVFKTLAIRQQKSMIPKKWETNEINPNIMQITAMREFSGYDTTKGTPGRCQHDLSWGDGAESSWTLKWLEFIDQGTEEESVA